MNCPQCQEDNPPQAKFCMGCAAPLIRACTECQTQLPAAAKFCPECAHPVGAQPTREPQHRSPEAYTPKHLAEKILTTKSALEGERKQVTVLFADLKGSMELLADRDPEESRTLLNAVVERMMEAVHRYEGTVNNVMGDGIMAIFGAPLAHEDHAVRACYAALRMQEAVSCYSDEIQRSLGVPIMIRVGLNSGEVVVGSVGNDLKMDYTAVGQTTHLAARMEQMAKPGTILITVEALRLAEGYVQAKALGPFPVKGLTDRVEVYEVTGGGSVRTRLEAAARRGFSRFVGRDTEMEQLRHSLEAALDGRGQVVAVVGEAGVGKSRLFWEFTRSHGTEGWLILESCSSSYGKATAYFPVVGLLKEYFKVQDGDDHREIREKVTGKLLTLDTALENTLPAFLTLLDVPSANTQWEALDPPQRRQRTLEAVKMLLFRESQVQPVCLVFEDLHWIDSETQALLDSLIESLPSARLLLLVNYRPEYQHGWGSKTYYNQLRIDPLPPESAAELLQSLLGDDTGLEPLRQLLISRTEGNPFFLEESVRTLVETKALVGERGAYRLSKPIEAIEVPATVQAVLAARIDRLSPEDKLLLQSASVIGETIPLTLLQAVMEIPEEELCRGLSRLQAAEFLYETSLFPDVEYTFKHGLTYQVAYNSLLVERRRILHAVIVEVMESLYADRVTEHIERLAHHAFQGEVWDKAVIYLRAAGAKATAHTANQEAAVHFNQALKALDDLPESRDTLAQAIDIRVELGPVLMATKGFAAPEVESSYGRAQELCERFGETPQLFPVLWGQWMVNNVQGHNEKAQRLGERLLGLAERAGDSALLLQAHHALWTTLFTIGDLPEAQEHQKQGLVLYDPQQHRSHSFLYGGHDPGVCCRAHSAMSLWMLGYPDQALTSAQDALRLARELSHSFSTTVALNWAAWAHYHRGEHREATELARAVVELATEQGFSLFHAHGLAFLAGSMAEEGHNEEGLAELESALAALKATGATGGRATGFVFCLLAEACAKQRQTERGLESIAEGLLAVGRSIYGPELLRLKGELLLGSDVPAVREAEACFREAIDLAQSHCAKSLELRVVMSLSRLLHQQGKKYEARQILGEIYGWFTEGFDTADLKEAKALLDELS